MKSGNTDAAELLRAMRSFLKENDMMAYLTMLAARRKTSKARATSRCATNINFSGGPSRWSMRFPSAARKKARIPALTASSISRISRTGSPSPKRSSCRSKAARM